MRTRPTRPGHRRAIGWLAGVAVVSAGGWAGPAAAQSAGEVKAKACAVCHGPQGIAVAPEAPNLAGQPEHYLSTQLRAYRSGARQHAVMNVIAKPLADQDIADLAAWFAGFKVEATRPP
jgi:cytochrome c553